MATKGKKATGYEPYQNTNVHWMKTQGEIGALLNKHGIGNVRWTVSRDRQAIMLEFVRHEQAPDAGSYPVGVRIVVPGVTEQNLNQMHRVLFYYLKSKFEALRSGLVEFAEEFFAHVMVPGHDGRVTTIYRSLGPQYREAAIDGRVEPLELFLGQDVPALTDGRKPRD